jgi:predicted aconitase with swiveling domain
MTHDAVHDDSYLHGRKVVGGVAEGEALVTTDRISGWGGIDPRTGTIIETRHELRGQSFAGKVLVFPGAKGSSGWSNQFHLTRLTGAAPAAMLFNEMTTKIALGAVVTRAPAMTDFDRDPLEVHRDRRLGDRCDADRGVVEVIKQATATGCRHDDQRKLRSNFPRGSYLWAVRNAQWHAMGIPEEDCEKPKIAVVNSSSELAACYSHLDQVARR